MYAPYRGPLSSDRQRYAVPAPRRLAWPAGLFAQHFDPSLAQFGKAHYGVQKRIVFVESHILRSAAIAGPCWGCSGPHRTKAVV